MQEKSIIKQNILKYLDFIGITPYKFYQQTSITRGVLTQNNGMSEENTTRFLDYFPDVSPEWLLTGKGDMLKNTNALDNVLNEPMDSYGLKDDKQGIPLIPLSAMAGFGEGESAVLEVDCERFVIPTFKGADFLITVKGSSMQPKYNSGDIVACKKLPLNDLFFQWNKVYVLDTIQGALVKRIRKGSTTESVLIASDNEKYEPFELHKNQINAVALVIGVIRLE